MKRFTLLLMAGLILPVSLHAQDAATQERLDKLSAEVDDLIAARDAQNKQMEALAKQVRDLQDQAAKPNVSYATSDDLKQLADKLQEVDQKRQQDNQRVLAELEKLAKTLSSASSARHSARVPDVAPTASAGANAGPQKGFEYIVKPGDTLGAIVRAYREQNIRITLQQVLNANPGLKPETMRVGQKIFIPAPGQ